MSKPPSGNLGRGLGDLFSEASTARTTIPAFEQGYARIPAKIIDLPDWMGARNRNTEALDALAASIRQHGILHPLLVRKTNDRYTILSGGRRYAAALRCGLSEIPVLILPENGPDDLDVYLADNLQALQPALEADAPEVTDLCAHFGITPEQLREKIQQLAPFTAHEPPQERVIPAAPPPEPPIAEDTDPAQQTEPEATADQPDPPPSFFPPEQQFQEDLEHTASRLTPNLYRNLFYATLALLAVIVITGIMTLRSRPSGKAQQTAALATTPDAETAPQPETIAPPAKQTTAPTLLPKPTASPVPTAAPQPFQPVKPAMPPKQAPALPAGLDARLQIAGMQFTQKDNRITITLDQPAFSYRTQLSPAAEAILESIALALRPDADQLRLIVHGHTDDDPITSSAYHSNYDLGLQRAAAAAEYLHRTGNLPMQSILIQSEAAQNTPFPNQSPETKRKNRTITLEITPGDGLDVISRRR
jgi:flagellar motor protein MotB